MCSCTHQGNRYTSEDSRNQLTSMHHQPNSSNMHSKPIIAKRPFSRSARSLCVSVTSVIIIGGSLAKMFCCPRSLVVIVIVNYYNNIKSLAEKFFKREHILLKDFKTFISQDVLIHSFEYFRRHSDNTCAVVEGTDSTVHVTDRSSKDLRLHSFLCIESSDTTDYFKS